MEIVVQCSGCGGKFRAPDKLAGKQVKCPRCAAVIQVGTTVQQPTAQSRPVPEATQTSAVPQQCPKCGLAHDWDGRRCGLCGFQAAENTDFSPTRIRIPSAVAGRQQNPSSPVHGPACPEEPQWAKAAASYVLLCLFVFIFVAGADMTGLAFGLLAAVVFCVLVWQPCVKMFAAIARWPTARAVAGTAAIALFATLLAIMAVVVAVLPHPPSTPPRTQPATAQHDESSTWKEFTDAGARFRCRIPAQCVPDELESGPRSRTRLKVGGVEIGVIVRRSDAPPMRLEAVEDVVRQFKDGAAQRGATVTVLSKALTKVSGYPAVDVVYRAVWRGQTVKSRAVKCVAKGHDHAISLIASDASFAAANRVFDMFLQSYVPTLPGEKSN